jgi:predicted RNase H-like HicB family nuclease
MLVLGATEEEAIENIKDAISGYLATVDRLLTGVEIRGIQIGEAHA